MITLEDAEAFLGRILCEVDDIEGYVDDTDAESDVDDACDTIRDRATEVLELVEKLNKQGDQSERIATLEAELAAMKEAERQRVINAELAAAGLG